MMKKLSLLFKTLISACGVGILIWGITWLLGWHSPAKLSNSLFMVGAILIVVGMLSLFGSHPMREDHKML